MSTQGLRGPVSLVLGPNDEGDLFHRPEDDVNLVLGNNDNINFVPVSEDEVDIVPLSDDKVNLVLGSVEKVDFILGHEDDVDLARADLFRLITRVLANVDRGGVSRWNPRVVRGVIM